MKTPTLIDNPAKQRYEMAIEGYTALVDYLCEPGLLRLTHTYVPPVLEGRGVGSLLVEGVLQDARSKGLKVVPECIFIERYLQRHPEWAEIVAWK